MARPYTGKATVSTFEETRANGTVYIYEKTSWYDREKGYTRSSKKLLGIKDAVTGELRPTRPKKSQNEVPSNEDLVVGKKQNAMISIVQHMSTISGVTDEVKAALPKDRGTSEKILTLAWYTFATEGRTWTRAENWTKAHLSELPYSYGPITESIYQELFHYLGEHNEIQWSIFRQRAQKLGDGELLALDSTLIVCENSSVVDARTTRNKEGTVSGAYKVIYLYSITARQLIAYSKIPGNIPDTSTVSYALDQFKALELKGNIEIVQDNGYVSELNIGQYLHAKRHFVTRLEPDCMWIRDEIEKYLPIIKDGGQEVEILRADSDFTGVRTTVTHKFPYIRKYSSKAKGLSAGDTDYVEATINIYILYSGLKQGRDDSKLRKQLNDARKDIENGATLDEETQKIANKYIVTSEKDGIVTTKVNASKYKNAIRYNGLLIIAADNEKDIDRALIKYRSRETIEEGIEGHKGHTGGDTRKCGNDDSLDGELLIEFLGNSMRESIRSKIRGMGNTLATPNGDTNHDSKANLLMEAKVKRWIRKKSIVNILESFDRKFVTVVKHGKKKYEISVPETKQEAVFLRSVGVIE